MVFFHYDETAYHKGHYKKGYYEFERDGFGSVGKDENSVVDCLKHVLDNGLVPDKVYLERMNAFFKFNDTENCKRNFEAICELL